jgi:branched-chain amino acid aminotransferase
MAERTVYINGKLVPASEATISVFDRAVQWGDAVYDAARTFKGKPFKLREHIDRLYRTCAYTRMPLRMSADEMEKRTLEVIEHNTPLLGPHDDDMIWWNVTRGVNPPTRTLADCREATVIIYTFPLPFRAWARWTQEGARVVTPATRRTPPQCVDPRAKISNKMNHILADLEVKGADPDAYSLMLDLDGNIAENSGANFFFVRGSELCTSPTSTVLEGITRATVMELARAQQLRTVEGDFSVYDVYTADEAFLTTTTYCILPVARLNGAPIGGKAPGPVTRRLTEAWSRMVGVDIVAQAQHHLSTTAGGR